MKRLLILIALTVISLKGFSQETETKTIYAELVGMSTLLGKVVVEIDMGEAKGVLGLNSSYIIDETTGKSKKFNSMVDAMNYMGENGWTFEQAYVVSLSTSNVYHWLLSQNIEKGADGKFYPATKKTFGSK